MVVDCIFEEHPTDETGAETQRRTTGSTDTAGLTGGSVGILLLFRCVTAAAVSLRGALIIPSLWRVTSLWWVAAAVASLRSIPSILLGRWWTISGTATIRGLAVRSLLAVWGLLAVCRLLAVAAAALVALTRVWSLSAAEDLP